MAQVVEERCCCGASISITVTSLIGIADNLRHFRESHQHEFPAWGIETSPVDCDCEDE